MQNTLQKQETSVTQIRKFENSEQLWFWFLHSRSIIVGLGKTTSAGRRICEPIDVETLITRLYLCGKLNESQLEILKIFGDKRCAPKQHIWSENRAFAIWTDAMETIKSAAFSKGWIE